MEEEDVQEALSFVNDINAGCYGCGCATIIFIVAIIGLYELLKWLF